MPTHQEFQMVNYCTVCRTANHSGKTCHSAKFCYAKGGKEKEREGMETAKVGMTVKIGQSERDGQLEHIRQRLGATKTSRNDHFGA